MGNLPPKDTKNAGEIAQLLEEDEDYVALPRYGHSLTAVIARYPDGAPLHVVARALQMTEDEAEELEQAVVAKMRLLMRVGE